MGGGNIGKGFWEAHPDAVAINATGKAVSDTEYKFGSIVPSIFHPAYLEKSRAYIRNLVEALPHEKFLYFETTVEPQYIGIQNIDYSPAARNREACRVNNLDGPTGRVLPSAGSSITWNRFRAKPWRRGSGDADTIRAVVITMRGLPSTISKRVASRCLTATETRAGFSNAFGTLQSSK